jgi:hypothetical protein
VVEAIVAAVKRMYLVEADVATGSLDVSERSLPPLGEADRPTAA